MATITFDTLKFSKKLREAGVPEAQAEALAEVQKEALSEVMDSTLATKRDVQDLKEELIKIQAEITLMKWMMGVTIGGIVTLILKAFFK